MKVESVLFANQAATEGPLLNVQGGGWEHYEVPSFPAQVRGFLCGVLVVDENEVGALTAVSLSVEDEQGEEQTLAAMVMKDRRQRTHPQIPIRQVFAIPFSLLVKMPHLVTMHLRYGDDSLATLAFEVRLMPS